MFTQDDEYYQYVQDAEDNFYTNALKEPLDYELQEYLEQQDAENNFYINDLKEPIDYF